MDTPLPSLIPYESAIFPDFMYMPDPRAETKYQLEDAKRRKVSFGPTSRLVTEANIIREWTSDNASYLPADRIEYHFIRYTSLLVDFLDLPRAKGPTLPMFTPDPWYQENIWCLFKSMQDQRAGSCFFGNQNQGKTEFFCVTALALGCLHPQTTNQVMMAPVKDDAKAGIWTRFVEIARRAWQMVPHRIEALGAYIDYKDSEATLYFCQPHQRPGGYIKIHAAANCGSIQGRKERPEGFLVHWLDEIGNAYPNGGNAWLETLPNIASNERYFCALACNPRNPEGGLDSEMQPTGGWEEQTEEDYFWKAASHNINVYRRSGLQSPNFRPVVGGTPVEDSINAIDPDKKKGLRGPFPWLYNGRRERNLRETCGGNLADARMKEQGRGMMPAVSQAVRVITQRDIDGSGMDLGFLWTPGPGETQVKLQRVAFLDPAKTAGGDRNILTLLEFGYRSEDGEAVPTIHIREQMELAPTGAKVVDHGWLQDCQRVRRREKGNGELGTKVSFVKELAILAAKQCLQWNVPFAHFGFDDSMSGDVTQAMIWAFGDSCTALSFGSKATTRPILPRKFVGEGKERRLLTYADLHKKHVSELYSRLAHWMRGGYLRMKQEANHNDSSTWQKPTRWQRETMQRLCKVPVGGGMGWDVERKEEYKSRKGHTSPDWADSLIGALHMIEAVGLMRVEAVTGQGDDDWGTRRAKGFRKEMTLSPRFAA